MRIDKNRIKGALDRTGTLSKVEDPGTYSGIKAPEQSPAPLSALEIEHGSSPMGLRRAGKKFLHLKKELRKRYNRTKP